MAKKREEEPPKGAPAWQSTFADLMNLLLCFFVLLFSMSTVDAEKLAAVAASFSQTFSIFQAGATAIGDGMLISNGVSQLNELDAYINSTGKAADAEVQTEDFMKEFEEAKMAAAEELAEQVSEAVAESEYDSDIDVEFTSQYVSLTLNGAVLFDSGSAELKEESKPILDKVGQILTRYADSTVEIEGHTDNVPIHNSKFESNDVLSDYRALAVFNYFMDTTALDPAYVKHSGRGEYVPVADNSTAEGRMQNRRVEIKIFTALAGE
ncbi:MAG: chemotaxis protein [Lachnospiraceae bacterium]|jgi:chemotaxis protein MotB|nr:chemotaxis protein [Lachnospiraceae bacterium]